MSHTGNNNNSSNSNRNGNIYNRNANNDSNKSFHTTNNGHKAMSIPRRVSCDVMSILLRSCGTYKAGSF